jgi:CRISPR-associated endonuclease/helicase Cas3
MSRGMSRAERLREMESLYLQRAFSDAEMAERLGVDRTTVFKDRRLLSEECSIDQDDEGRYKIDRTRYLSNVRVNLQEALVLYLAMRRASRQTRFAQSHVIRALEKVALTLRQPMTERLVKAANVVLTQPAAPEREAIVEAVVRGWAEQRKVRIVYQGLHARQPWNFLVSPYLIEPAVWSDGAYLIGHSDVHGDVAVFKIERILEAFLTLQTFTIPESFDEGKLLNYAWGIWHGEGEPETVRLQFRHGEATRRIKETVWHRLENVTDTPDGGCIWSAPIGEWQEMLPWIRGWGADVEVLEPKELREALKREAQKMAEVYQIREVKPQDELIAHIRKDRKEQLLVTHLVEASQKSEEFAAKVGLPEIGKVMGLLHDFGKASQEYQNYLRTQEGLINPDEDNYSKAKRGEVDHSTAGAQLIFEKLANREQEGKILAQFLALAIASHHSGLIDCLKPDGFNEFQRRIGKDDKDTNLKEARRKLPDIEKQLDEILAQPLEKQFFEKIMGMRDAEKDVTLPFKHGLLARFLLSCVLEADRLNTADFEHPNNEAIRNYGKYVPWDVLIERLEAKYAVYAQETAQMKPGRALEVNQLRAQVAQACLEAAGKPKGIYQLTVPTGGGKTEASLRFALHHAKAHNMDRVFYIVPFITIIDQNADKIRDILERTDERGKVILEHHSNFVPEDDTRYRHNLLAENWDAPIVFTTQVQFLEALFGSGTRDARRMHQLANSVIIFDEVQTVPLKITHMFNAALRFLTHDCGATVVLCTATQPPLDKLPNEYRRLTIAPEHQIIQNPQELFEKLKRVEVHDERKPDGWTNAEIADLAERALREKGSVLIVVNTRPAALAVYQEIKNRNLGVPLYHLSTNMCAAHREEVLEKEIKPKLNPKTKQPVICVSTQLIEAGVDIDFGAVIRSLAGLDSIAQSAGRCNRHGLREDGGSVWVVNPQEENLASLPDIQIGRDHAETILRFYEKNPDGYDRDSIGLKAIAKYYQMYFDRRANELNYPVSRGDKLDHDDNLFNLLGRNSHAYKGQVDEASLKQSFMIASKIFCVIDSPTIGVIVPYEEGKEIITALCGDIDMRQKRELLKLAQRYSVQLFRGRKGQFELLTEKGAIHQIKDDEIFYLVPYHYDNEIGWSEEPTGNQEVLCF